MYCSELSQQLEYFPAVEQCVVGIDSMTLMKGVHGASWVRKEYSGALRAGTWCWFVLLRTMSNFCIPIYMLLHRTVSTLKSNGILIEHDKWFFLRPGNHICLDPEAWNLWIQLFLGCRSSAKSATGPAMSAIQNSKLFRILEPRNK